MKAGASKKFLMRGERRLLFSMILTISVMGCLGVLLDKHLKELRLKEVGHGVNKAAFHITNYFQGAVEDARFLEKDKAFEGLFRALENGGIDKRTSFTVNQWRDQIHAGLEQLLTAKPKFWSVALMSMTGKELISAKLLNGKVVFKEFEKLKNFKSENLYKKSVMLEKNEYLYFSSKLAMENDKIARPLRSVSKLVTPINSASGVKKGYLIFDIDLHKIRPIFEEMGAVLASNDGKILIHSRPEYEMIYDANKEILLTEVMSDFSFKEVLSKTKNNVFINNGFVLGSKSVFLNKGQKDVSFKVLLRRNKNIVFTGLNTARFVFIGIILTLFLVVYFLNRKFLKKSHEKYHDVALQISTGLQSLNSITKELSIDSSEVAQKLNYQGGTLKSLRLNLEELSEFSNKKIDGMGMTSDNTRKELRVCQNIEQSVNTIKKGLESIYENFEEIEKETTEISSEKEDINNSLTLVVGKSRKMKELLFQMKLMVFNLGLEAVKQGDSGRGQLVVTQELGRILEKALDSFEIISDDADKANLKVNDLLSNRGLNSRTSFIQARKSIEDVYPLMDEGLVKIQEVVSEEMNTESNIEEMKREAVVYSDLISEVNNKVQEVLETLNNESGALEKLDTSPQKLLDEVRIIEMKTKELEEDFAVTVDSNKDSKVLDFIGEESSSNFKDVSGGDFKA